MHKPNNTVPAEACSPDADRGSPDASPRLPERLVHCLALIVLFLRSHLPHYRRGERCRRGGTPGQTCPPARRSQLAASIRGEFGNAIAWMCRRHGIGPGHPEWPELSRAIVAFGGSVRGFRAGLPACGLQWWENPEHHPRDVR